MLLDILIDLAEAAILETRHPRPLERNDAIYWRTGGPAETCQMVRLTADSNHLTMQWECV